MGERGEQLGADLDEEEQGEEKHDEDLGGVFGGAGVEESEVRAVLSS